MQSKRNATDGTRGLASRVHAGASDGILLTAEPHTGVAGANAALQSMPRPAPESRAATRPVVVRVLVQRGV